MDPTQLLIVVAVAVVLVAVLIARQLADYKQQVAQLDPKKTKKPREFGVHTVEEVAKHNNRDDAWIIVQHKETKEWRVYVSGCSWRVRVTDARWAGDYPVLPQSL